MVKMGFNNLVYFNNICYFAINCNPPPFQVYSVTFFIRARYTTPLISEVFWQEGVNQVTVVELQSECPDLTLTLTENHVIDGPVNGDVI